MKIGMLLSVFFSVAVVACSIQTGPAGSGSSPEGTPAGTTSARCVGRPVEAYKVRDSGSCSAQGSTWDNTNLECRGTSFVVNCARVEYAGRPEEAVRMACLDMPGCGFTEADGTVTKPSGRCEGTKIACSAFSQTDCNSQPGCFYYSSEGCTVRNGKYYLDNSDCPSLQISDSVSFSVVKDACKRAKGCTWVE
jgi:hypothetical protein